MADAFVRMYYLEASCAIQVRAQSGGGELIPVPKEVMDAGYAAAKPSGAPRRPGRARVAGAAAPARPSRSFVQELSVMRFTGKVALITAAGRGIGRATAEIIGREGGTVVAVDNDKAALEQVLGAVRAAGGTAHGLRPTPWTPPRWTAS